MMNLYYIYSQRFSFYTFSNVYKRIHYIANQRDFHVLEINREQDHVHILLTADTITSPAELANVLKTKRPEVPENCTERQS